MEWLKSFRLRVLGLMWEHPNILEREKTDIKTRCGISRKYTMMAVGGSAEEHAKEFKDAFVQGAPYKIVREEEVEPSKDQFTPPFEEGESRSVTLKKNTFRRYRESEKRIVRDVPDDHFLSLLEKEGKVYTPPKILDPTGKPFDLGLNERPLLHSEDVCIPSLSMRAYTQKMYGVNAKIESLQPMHFAGCRPRKRDITNIVSSDFMEKFTKRFKNKA